MDENQTTNESPSLESGAAQGHLQAQSDGGVLGATRRPLLLALCGGVNAAAAVLAVVFLAGGVVRKDHGMLAFGVALVVGAVVAAAAPKWLEKGRFARLRTGLLGASLLIGCAVAGRGVWALVTSAGERLGGGSPASASNRPQSKDVLLVTLDQQTGAMDVIDPARLAPGFEVLDSIPSSPRREPCLASVLTGLEVIEHRLLFSGDDVASHALNAAEIFASQGYATHGFGLMGLPVWARRGVQQESLDSLAAALALLQVPASRPRFVHVHLREHGLVRSVAASMGAVGQGTVVAVVLLPEEAAGRDQSRLWWGSAGAAPSGAGTVSSVSVLPSLLRIAGVEPPIEAAVEAADGPVLFRSRGRSAGPAVTFAHGAAGAVHRLTAYFEDWKVELDLTPLGRHPFDDWQIEPSFAEHFVYGNGLRVTHRRTLAAPAPSTLEGLMGRIAAWRARNGGFEDRE